MVLRTRARRSDEEMLQERLNALPEQARAWFDTPLVDVAHSKSLRAPTKHVHARVRKLWTLFVSNSQDPEVRRVGAEITHAMVTPSIGVIKAFVRFLAVVVQGKLEESATASTVSSYVDTLYSALARGSEGRVIIDKDTRKQVHNYLASDDLREQLPLSTIQREKHYASMEDIHKLIDSYYADARYFRTNRMRVQMCALTLLLTFSTERIGALVESNCYRGSNEGLAWKDVGVVITPNPKTPSRPDVAIRVTVRLLKGGREVQSYFKIFCIFPEDASGRPYCPVLPLLVLGIQDHVWESIDRAEDILAPRVPPTVEHTLQVRPCKRDLLVFRAEVRSKVTGWSISASEAMDYGVACQHLRFFSRLNGFPADVRPYDIRRGAANVIANDASISVEQREKIMAHSVRSKTYQRSYESMAVRVDVQGALSGSQREGRLAFITGTESMSRGADPNAPTRASAEALMDLYRDEDMIEWCKSKHRALVADSNDKCDQEEVMKKTFTRERRLIARETRQMYFTTASTRQLEGATLPVAHRVSSASAAGCALLARHARPVVATILAEPEKYARRPLVAVGNDANTNADAGPSASMRVDRNFANCVDTLVRHLYSEVAETDRHEALLTACRLLLAMPVACHALCYPGEFPTPDNCCPVCKCLCRFQDMNRGVAPHIHRCFIKAKQVEADAELDTSYVPTRCCWDTCRGYSKTWSSRHEFVAHMQGHTRTAHTCGWVNFDGAACGENEIGDWPAHLARRHAINICNKATVNYCYICSEWFRDIAGDGLDWEVHCQQHYVDLFAPFSQRREDDVDIEPVGIYVYPEAYNWIGYDVGGGYGGRFPEYHGHIEHGMAFAPMFCIWCVNNQELPIEARMTQYHDRTVFYGHLATHTRSIDELSLCPSPSCGLKMYCKHDLLHHLVTVHRLGVCGLARGGPDCRLKLPETPKRPFAEEPSSLGRKRPRKANAPAFKCKGCYKVFQRIDRHIGNGERCRRVACYVRVVDGEAVGEEIRWARH